MEGNIRYLLTLLDSVIHDKDTPVPPENIDWNKVWTAARAGEIATLLYKKLNQLEGGQRPPEEIMNAAKYCTLQCGSMNIQKYAKLYQVLEEGRKRNIPIVVFKGPVLAQLYPEPMLRNFCDVDFYVETGRIREPGNLIAGYGIL